MIALWYRDGELEPAPAPWPDGRRLGRMFKSEPVRIDDPRALFNASPESPSATIIDFRARKLRKDDMVFHPWTRRERRRIARRYSGPGRRGALRISRGITERRLIAETMLYLPYGESVEQRHCDDVERWLAARGMADTREEANDVGE